MAQPVDGGRGDHAVRGEGFCPLADVEVAGDDGGRALVAVGDQVVQVLVGRGARGLRPKSSMTSSGKRASAASLRSLAPVARCVQAWREGSAAGEDNVHALARRAVARGPRRVALADAAGPGHQHRGLRVQMAPGGQVMHQGPVEIGQTPDVRLRQRRGNADLPAAQPWALAQPMTPWAARSRSAMRSPSSRQTNAAQRGPRWWAGARTTGGDAR